MSALQPLDLPPDLVGGLTAGAAGFAAHRSAAPVTGPLSGSERDARHLVSVDHSERSSRFDTIPVAPVYLRVDTACIAGQERDHLPLVALDGVATEVARFRHLADLAHWLRRGEAPATLPLPLAQAARRRQAAQRDHLLDPQIPLVTDDLAERVQRWLSDRFGVTADGHAAVHALRERGLGLVDAARQRFLIDETVYSGAQFRSGRYLVRAEQAEKLVRLAVHVMPSREIWAGLAPSIQPETEGERL